uniref:SFRICE_024351 n=1 Tax=Spodoptera frugiperda TaxID=7108 RepID=A0A2H1W7N9_SPOFR
MGPKPLAEANRHAIVTPLVLRASMGGVDYLPSGNLRTTRTRLVCTACRGLRAPLDYHRWGSGTVSKIPFDEAR